MEIIERVDIHDIDRFTQWANKENLKNDLPKTLKKYADEHGKEIRSIEVEYSGSDYSYRADGYVTFVTKED